MRNISSIALKLIVGAFLSLTGAYSCSVVRPVIPKEEVHIVYKDSTRIKDSTVVVPIERIVDIVPDIDTLKLETSLAKAKAWIDSNHLKGSIENKQQIIYKYIEKEKIVTDTTYIEKPVPYEVEKEVRYIPRFYKWLLAFDSLLLIVFIVYIIKKFKIFSIFS